MVGPRMELRGAPRLAGYSCKTEKQSKRYICRGDQQAHYLQIFQRLY